MTAIKKLERDAIKAYRLGQSWAAFWRVHGDAIRQAEPFDRDRYQHLVDRLLSLLVTGDVAGLQPTDDAMPWEQDDGPKPPDVGTQARLLVDSIADV